jgi:hypothetical protein
MPSLWQILISLGVALTAVSVTAWINLQIKFAPTREAAVHDLKHFAFKIFRWGMNGLNVCLLFWYVSSSAPVTRLVVFVIAFQMASLVLAVVLTVTTYVDTKIIEGLAATTNTLGRHVKVTTEAITATHEIIGEHQAVTRKLVEAKRVDRDATKE